MSEGCRFPLQCFSCTQEPADKLPTVQSPILHRLKGLKEPFLVFPGLHEVPNWWEASSFPAVELPSVGCGMHHT
jgi:hypothetical protein